MSFSSISSIPTTDGVSTEARDPLGDLGSEITAAERLLQQLETETLDPPGITRDTYGPGENRAHARMESVARELGLAIDHDGAGNLYMTLPGSRPDLPSIMIGSHLDSVPHGGNFDGAAGVVAGLMLLRRLKRWGRIPQRSVTVMAARGEELCWFPYPYIGSQAAFGQLPVDVLDNLKRLDHGGSLGSCIGEAGFDPDRLRRGESYLKPDRILCYLELHIEQGPTLVDAGIPVGIVTGIRGNLRYPYAKIFGHHAHAGAVPRHLRQDAVLAGVELVTALEQYWIQQEAQGVDLVATVGEFYTNPEHHTLTKIPGEVSFTLDIRSESLEVLGAVESYLNSLAEAVSQRRRVQIDLGSCRQALPGRMDPELRGRLNRLATQQGIPALELASGAGHDCAVFANQGIPTAMIFVRNENGSHNPDEAMTIEDFAQGFRLLVAVVDELLEG